MGEELVAKEYFALLETVRSFDERLMTVKGWGITLSLAGLGVGFQTGHYGLFLVAAFKSFQMRYYVRMREIEVRQAELAAKDGGEQVFAPQIDWSWRTAGEYFSGRRKPEEAPRPPRRYGRSLGFLGAWLLPQVFLPHVISVVAGGILFGLGVEGLLPMKL